MYESFTQSLKTGKNIIDIMDFSKFGASIQEHLCLIGILEFVQKYITLPELLNEEDAKQLLELVKLIN